MVQLTDKQKYEIIVLREQNYKINEIADKMNINRKTVMNWINNYEKNDNVDRKKGSGRKRITSNEDDICIVDIIENNNDLCLSDIKNILKENDINVSIETIRRRLIENEYVYKFPIKKPLLTENHKKRLEWCIENSNRNWNNIIFSDESAIKINGFIKKKWIKKDTQVIEMTIKYPLKVNIWGCFYKH